MEKIDTSDLLRVATAAHRKSVKPESLYALIRSGVLPYVEIDGVKFVHWKDVQNYQPRNYQDRRRTPFQLEAQGSRYNGRQTALASENALRKIWDTPEEDEAWEHL